MEEKVDKFDKRILELELRSKKISKKEYESYLKSLPDSEPNAEWIEIAEDETQPETIKTGLTFTV